MKTQPYSRPLKLLLLTTIFFFKSYSVFAQKYIHGYVRDSNDKLPLISASVTIKGTNSGTMTDTSGFFRLIVKKGETLVFSYLGYTPQEVTIGSDTVLNISLSKSFSNLDQVVVTGYTSQR